MLGSEKKRLEEVERERRLKIAHEEAQISFKQLVVELAEGTVVEIALLDISPPWRLRQKIGCGDIIGTSLTSSFGTVQERRTQGRDAKLNEL